MKIYLYGMICGSNSFKLGAFLKPDEYSEIQEQYHFIGGETGTAANILSSLGADVRVDGNYIGRKLSRELRDFYADKSVDISPLTFDDSFEGLEDYVIISDSDRTPMGNFGRFFADYWQRGIKRWNTPKAEDIADCDAAAIDAFFAEDSELAAKLCTEQGKPYVTIDCKYDSYIHKHAAVTVISGESLRNNYDGIPREEIFPRFAENSEGLTIITNGGGEILYGRKGGEMKRFMPFKVNVASTLGAGDTFKAGSTYALAEGMSDDEVVRFASACAAAAISRYPMQLDPPKLGEVTAIMKSEE